MKTSKQKVLVGFITSVAIIFVIIGSEQGFASDRQLASNEDSKMLNLVCTGKLHEGRDTVVIHYSLRNQNEFGSYTEFRENAYWERVPIRRHNSDLGDALKSWEDVFYTEKAWRRHAKTWHRFFEIKPESYIMTNANVEDLRWLDRVTLELKGYIGIHKITPLPCAEASLEDVAEREKQILVEKIRRFDEERTRASKGSKKAKI